MFAVTITASGRNLKLCNSMLLSSNGSVVSEILFTLYLKISLLAARNERESVQIAIRPKVSWGGSGLAGVVQVQCTDLCSTSGDRLVS